MISIRSIKIKDSMVQGDLESIRQSRNAVIGRTLAEDLELKLGDKLQATFPRARATQSNRDRDLRFRHAPG